MMDWGVHGFPIVTDTAMHDALLPSRYTCRAQRPPPVAYEVWTQARTFFKWHLSAKLRTVGHCYTDLSTSSCFLPTAQ